MKRISMRELANELQFSVATVSKALNDSHEISEETKRKVKEAACRLNYILNPYASSLRNKRSKTIALVLPEVADNFFSLAINGVQSVAEKKDYHVLIYLSHEKLANERMILSQCSSGRVDGVLMSVSSETTDPSHIIKLQQQGIPIVFFDREFEGLHIAKVITNDFESGYLSASHLIRNGCKNPVFLSLSSNLSICNNRAKGFKAALVDNKIADADKAIVECRGTNHEVDDKLKKLLSGKSKPDGIVASVERLALSVYLVCQDLNVSIPSELKVVVFSTLITAPILNPPLTAIVQPAFETDKTAAELLFKGIEKKRFNLQDEIVMLPSTLVERTSSQS